jgi:hypothetical protein
MFLSRRGKVHVLDERNERVELDIPLEAQDTERHVANFVESIRSGRHPNADIEIGHLSASLSHLGNMAVRLGRSLNFDGAQERVVNDEQADRLVSREYRPGHWAVPKGAA